MENIFDDTGGLTSHMVAGVAQKGQQQNIEFVPFVCQSEAKIVFFLN